MLDKVKSVLKAIKGGIIKVMDPVVFVVKEKVRTFITGNLFVNSVLFVIEVTIYAATVLILMAILF